MKVVLLYSGGLDSTVLLYDLVRGGNSVLALTVDYGQWHRREIKAATAICHNLAATLAVEHVVAMLPAEPFRGSALTGSGDVPVGPATVVPNRNMVLLSLAAALAVSRGYGAVAIACHEGDAVVYPDCRAEFIDEVRRTINLGCGRKIELFAPFLPVDKSWIVRRARELDVPIPLTWSCYDPQGDSPCLVCGACTERMNALALA